MGHYASEMSSNFGEPTHAERRLAEVPEDEVRELASLLLEGFDNSFPTPDHAIRAANAVDALIRKRISEVAELETPSSEA